MITENMIVVGGFKDSPVASVLLYRSLMEDLQYKYSWCAAQQWWEAVRVVHTAFVISSSLAASSSAECSE